MARAPDSHAFLTAEELEEERQDDAVRLIQNAYRAKRARIFLRALIRANYVKIRYPDYEGEYLYKNKTTGEIREDKPKFLGDEDLPNPRDFKAPYAYSPEILTDVGCAMIVTVSEFADQKITKLYDEAAADHRRLHNLLTHDFICRFKDEELVSLLDPTMSEFIDGLERLARMSKSHGFAFIFICTHAATIGGSPRSYLCFKDTSWKSSELARKTTISDAKLSDLIKKIPSKRKTLIFSVGHKVPRSGRFSIGKFYPHKDMFSYVADNAQCAVLGACNIGTNIIDQLMHLPPPERRKKRGLLPVIGSTKTNPAPDRGPRDNAVGELNRVGDGESSSSSDDEDDSAGGVLKTRKRSSIKYKRFRNHRLCPASIQHHFDDWEQLKGKRKERDDKKAKEPRPGWQRLDANDFQVVTPTAKEVYICSIYVYIYIYIYIS